MLFDKQPKPPTQPQTQNFTDDLFDPESLDDSLMGREDEGLPTPQPRPVMTAAVGKPPVPQQEAPPLPERSPVLGAEEYHDTPPPPEKSPFGLVKPDDSRYSDYQNLLVADVFLGGMLPWLQAAADLAAGRVDAEQFDAVRQEHQQRIQGMRQQHAGFVESAEKALPFVSGLLGGAGVGGVARGIGVAATQGAAQGFSSGPIEEPSLGGARAGQAAAGAIQGGTIGAVGAGVAKGVGAAAGAVSARKAAAEQARSADMAKQRADYEAHKQSKVAAQEADKDKLAGEYTQYQAMPPKNQISKHYKKNREQFASDPIGSFKSVAAFQPTLEGFAAALNMPATVVVQRMIPKMKDIELKTTGERNLYNEMRRVYESRTAAMEKGVAIKGDDPKPKAPAKPKDGRPTQAQFKKFRESPAGKNAAADIRDRTAKQQLDADAKLLKDTYNPGPVPRGGKNDKPLKLKDEGNGKPNAGVSNSAPAGKLKLRPKSPAARRTR